MTAALTATPLLVRFALRRDRLIASAWVLALVLLCYASAAATGSLYATVQQRVAAAEALNASPAIVALYGPILAVRSEGELAMTKMTVTYAVLVAVLNLVLVRRHTRVEEESGRTELVAGTVVGRHAPLAAAALVSVSVSLLVGLLAAAANVAGGLPVAGSLAFGAGWAGVGIVAGALTATACQLAASARTCAAIAAAGLGGLFVARAVGDTTLSWLSWLSPFGWSTQLRAYSQTRWWVLLLYLAAALVLFGLAQGLRSRRDLGSGLLAAPAGPANGSRRLSGPVTLCLRLQAASLATWSLAVAAMGLVFGAMAPQLGHLLDSPSTRQMIERLGGFGRLQETLVAAEISVVAVVVTCFAISVVGHAGTDERDGRTELVLATATSRSGSFLGMAVVALAGSAWLLLLSGAALSVGYGAAGGEVVRGIVPAAAAQVPAVWAVAGLATACFATRSDGTFVAWALLVLFLTAGQVGELLKLPAWVVGLSPYTHVPAMPAEAFRPASALVLTLVALALVVVSWQRYRVRDIRS